MEKRLFDLLADKITIKPVWDYKIWAPMSMEDLAEVRVVVTYGRNKAEYTETYLLKLELSDV